MHPFSTPEKNQKTLWFSVFGGRERVQWEQMGSKCTDICENFSFVEVSCEYVTVARWKDFIEVPHPSSLVEILKPHFFYTIYNLSLQKLLMAPVNPSAVAYCNE